MVSQAERAKGRTQERAAINDRRAPFRGIRLEVHSAVSIPIFFDKPIEAIVAVSQFGRYSLERTCHFLTAACVNM